MEVGQAIQGNVAVLRNHLRNLAHYLHDGAIVVTAAQ